MEITLSHYRKLFRVGGQAVDGLMDSCRDQDITVIVDEKIDNDRFLPLGEWFLGVGAKSVVFRVSQARFSALFDKCQNCDTIETDE